MWNLKDIVKRFPTIQDVVEFDSDYKESGSNKEYDDYASVFVCHINSQAYLVNFHWHMDARFPKNNSVSVKHEEKITEEQYQEYAKGGTLLDVSKAQSEIALKAMLREKKERLTPKCPKCEQSMEIKTNSKDRTHFWGCSNYNRNGCRGKRTGPNKEYLNLLDEINKL